ncbi:hypothetical protein [Dietzia sp. 179-F 9C3 NHS]|uniref:hypothetical protein n=1 Tax=Dietzia sp. 179-F 9C3 NHS TaxID=3374295 RepID=UPI00387907F5
MNGDDPVAAPESTIPAVPESEDLARSPHDVEERTSNSDGSGPGDSLAPAWDNDALRVEVLLDEDNPHQSVMEVLAGDLEGRLGAVIIDLGPMEVRALLHQLEDVLLAQEIAEWEAEGNDVEDFPLERQQRSVADYDDDLDGDDEGDLEDMPRRGVDRYTDPLAVKTWLGQNYRVFGVRVQYLLVGLAVFVGLVMAVFGVLL